MIYGGIGALLCLKWLSKCLFKFELWRWSLLLICRNRTAGILRHATERSLVIMDE